MTTPKYETRKRSPQAKRETVERKKLRRAKYIVVKTGSAQNRF